MNNCDRVSVETAKTLANGIRMLLLGGPWMENKNMVDLLLEAKSTIDLLIEVYGEKK